MSSRCELMENDHFSSNCMVGCDVVCSPLHDDLEWERLTKNSIPMSHKIRSTVDGEMNDPSAQKLYELQQPYMHSLLSTTSVGDGMSVRSSSSSTGSCSSERKLRETMVKKPRTKLEEKLKLIAHYLDNMSTGLALGQRSLRRKQRMDHVRVHAHKSAPDVLLHHRYNRRPAPTRSFTITQSTQPVSLPWDVICPDAIEIEEEEIEEQTPIQRIVQLLCDVCNISSTNLNTVMSMLTNEFGTVGLDVMRLDTLIGHNSLLFIGVLVFHSIDPMEQYIHHSSSSFIQFLKHIQDLYHSTNPFHNSCHAADVLHSLFILLSTSSIQYRIALHRRIAVLLAAILHDVGHNGFTNQFLIQSKHAIALQYKDSEAPMEGMHVDIAVNVLTNPSFGIFVNMSSVEQQDLIEVVRTTIRSTALVYQKELLNELNKATESNAWSTESDALLSIPLQLLLLRGLLHVSDISQTMKPFSIHSQWVARLNNEMFQQGDVDDRMQLSISPSYCFRRNWTQKSFLSSQIWFLENFSMPAITALQGVNGVNVHTFVISLYENINEWRRQLEIEQP